MKSIDTKLTTVQVDENNKTFICSTRFQVGKSEDNFATLSVETKNKTILTVRVCDLLKILRWAEVC